ncbi:MAG: phosphorylated adapter RNA export RNA-binding domain-containing protein, partial [Chloroflexota bacterium]
MNKDKPPHSESQKVAQELAALLGEKHHGVIGQIRRIVQLCGVDFTREMYTATLEIEANSGMMLPDHSRLRTPGGVFLHLVRSKLDDDQKKQVFYGKAKAVIPLFSWTKRI